MICKTFCCGLFTELMNNIHLNQASFMRTVNCRTGWKRQKKYGPTLFVGHFIRIKMLNFSSSKSVVDRVLSWSAGNLTFSKKLKKIYIKFVLIVCLYNIIDTSFLFEKQFYKLDLEILVSVYKYFAIKTHTNTRYVIKRP